MDIKKIAYGMVLIGLLLSTFIGMNRIQAEYQQKDVHVAVRYDDLLEIAKATNQSVAALLDTFYTLGAQTLLVREQTLAAPKSHTSEWEQNTIQTVDAQVLQARFEDATFPINYTYITAKDDAAFSRITNHLSQKGVPITTYDDAAFKAIGVPNDRGVWETIGTGFDEAIFKQAAAMGYKVSPELRSWSQPTDESIAWYVGELEQLPALSYIFFEDAAVIGSEDANMIAFVKKYGLGFTEFYAPEQVGFDTLAYKTQDKTGRFNLIRMLMDEKVPSISTPDRVVRYELALTERGIRAFVFEMDGVGTVEAQYSALQEAMKRFQQSLETQGYTLTNTPITYTYGQTPGWVLWGVGLTTAGILMLLAIHYHQDKLGLLFGSLLLMGYAIGLCVAPRISIQGMALLTAVLVPLYAVVQCIKLNNRQPLKDAIVNLLKLSGITFIGALTVVGLLSDASYALGIEGFRGVKVASLVPLVGVGILFAYEHRKQIREELQQFKQTQVKYWPLVIGGGVGLIAVVTVIYIMRTGNGEISELEKLMRQGLDQLLGVRPRTKEFMIGHPLMLVILYFGYKACYLPALLLAVIGQLSLLNTYAHIHTPLMVSVIRSAYGLGIGILIGIVLIQVIKFIFKVINKWIIK